MTALWQHALRNDLKYPDRKSIVGSHSTKGPNRLSDNPALERSDGVLDFSSPDFCFAQGRLEKTGKQALGGILLR